MLTVVLILFIVGTEVLLKNFATADATSIFTSLEKCRVRKKIQSLEFYLVKGKQNVSFMKIKLTKDLAFLGANIVYFT